MFLYNMDSAGCLLFVVLRAVLSRLELQLNKVVYYVGVSSLRHDIVHGLSSQRLKD